MWFKNGRRANQSISPAGRNILVTGATTGIGRCITEHLASSGFNVYAGARNTDDIELLGVISNVTALRLDVTSQQDVDDVVRYFRSAGLELHGVVNNAGVISLGSLIEVANEDVRDIFDVNVLGVIRTTKALAPLLIKSRGRVVNISSVSGVLSGEFFGLYSMSKHAIEAYTDSLAKELEPFNVSVTSIMPGDFNSQLGKNMLARIGDPKIAYGGSMFNEQIQRRSKWFALDFDGVMDEPDEVAKCVYDTLTVENPKRRYLITPDKTQTQSTLRKLLQMAAELSQATNHPVSNKHLHRMLDKELDS